VKVVLDSIDLQCTDFLLCSTDEKVTQVCLMLSVSSIENKF